MFQSTTDELTGTMCLYFIADSGQVTTMSSTVIAIFNGVSIG